jgi:hypothetical protein
MTNDSPRPTARSRFTNKPPPLEREAHQGRFVADLPSTESCNAAALLYMNTSTLRLECSLVVYCRDRRIDGEACMRSRARDLAASTQKDLERLATLSFVLAIKRCQADRIVALS